MAVFGALGPRDAAKIEDELRGLYPGFPEVTCKPDTPKLGITTVTYALDNRFTTAEAYPQPSDIVIDPSIEVTG